MLPLWKYHIGQLLPLGQASLNWNGMTATPTLNKYEAERGVLSGTATIATDHTGYSGAGFVAGFITSTSASVAMTVFVPSATTYAVTIRYSAGNGTSSNTSLIVNGSNLGILTFTGTANWDTWANMVVMVTLNSGVNTISLASTISSAACINIDYITLPNVSNIYACVDGGDIYELIGEYGSFGALSQPSKGWAGMAAAPNGDVYCCENGGDIYKRAGGFGNFTSLGQTSRAWHGMTANSNGDVYACVLGGDIYKQSYGAGAFMPLSQASLNWGSMTTDKDGDVYAGVFFGGDLYKQTGGAGNFNPLSQATLWWLGMASTPNKKVYACAYGDSIYMQTNETGNFADLNQTHRYWAGMAGSPNGNVYACVRGGDIYKAVNGF
jgi:hypothetical protein